MNRWMKRTGLLMFCFLFSGVRAEASAQDVMMKTEENKVEIAVGALEEDVLSMQLALEVRITEGNSDAEISFEFDSQIAGSVKQYRYDRDSGILNLYVSGNRDQTLASGKELCIGKVVLDPGTGTAAATVDVKPGSLQIVNDAYGFYRFGEINASPAQKITAGESSADVPDAGGEVPDAGGEVPDAPQEPSASEEASESEAVSSGSSSAGAVSGTSGGNTTIIPTDRTGIRKDVGIQIGSSRRTPGEALGNKAEDMQEASMDGEGTDRDTAEAVPAQGEDNGPSQETIREQWEAVPENTKDQILLAVLAVSGIAAGLVIFLMVQEYERKKRTRRRRRRGKRTDQSRKTTRRKRKKKTMKSQP